MDWIKRFFRQEQEIEDIEESSFEEVKETKQPPFRFPLISDEEKNLLLNKQSSPSYEDYSYEEPSYIRQQTNRESTKQKSTTQQTKAVPKKEESRPIVRSSKRYVPSVVPSPVFGLKTEQESTGSISRTMRTSHYDWSTTAVEEEPVVEQLPNEEVKLVEEVQVASEVAVTEEVVVAEEDTICDELHEMHMQPVEEEPINLAPPQETESKDTPVEELVEQPREKIKPFNVLMLTSDKRKLQQKAAPQLVNREKTKVEPPKVEPLKTEQPVAHYAMPNANFLHAPVHKSDDQEWMDQQAEHLVEALAHFQIQSEVLSIVQGPAVTQFELTVGQGTKVSKIRNLTDDLKLALAAKDIRIQAPIPGRRSIGIEIPNRTSRAVQLSEVIEAPVFKQAESPLEVAMGLDLHGQPVTMDLRKMPHGLIAGATGSGKSVFINSLLISLLYKASPQDVKLLLIDPKVVELAPFNHIPHLISPVITDVKAAAAALKWAVEEMERRYQLFAHAAVRDIGRFNQQAVQAREFSKKLPYIVIVIDELADMMMAAPQDVEDSICRIAQKARACGIHLVLATQRPSVDVITGLIKSNVPTRIAFSVSSQIDSRTILDQQGAERLLGKGDMLYLGSGMASPVRIQGTFVSDDEIDRIIEHARSQGEPDYFFKQEDLIVRAVEVEEQDEMFEEACRFVIEHGAASTSLLQRKFHLGYNRAARLMDAMETAGIISGQNGSKPREVLVSEEFLQEIL
ncbi:cell division protein FtsK [Chryseomicrobium excrementi]|uniref:Cell division protein FtsK n=1 Tax=Chryseomicrobium excrementi TaxID=2041346 RepID=A0A2M9F1L5_9BACL|nr:DNA translocase FtsK [Chryseomicrobium excrementi]PJK17353.1 cell division protein FtsK [Chryseomicrobium excrementi]